jgi:FAD/FMN-containing dehydrogenase
MPRAYLQRVAQFRPDLRQPFDPIAEVAILVELGALQDGDPLPDGSLPVVNLLTETLAQMVEEGMVLDAQIAQNEAQRAAMWARRECAAEVMQAVQPSVDTDICLPTDQIAVFLDRMTTRLPALDAGATSLLVAHLGDGNLHYSAYPSRDDPALYDAIIEAVEDQVQAMGGSFSAEHGVGLMKLNSMRRRKDPVALDVMRLLKATLDPQGIMNPGKVIPN